MKRLCSILLTLACTLACQDAGLQRYWDKYGTDIDNYAEARDRFATFAELVVKAPEEEGIKAVNSLLDKVKADEVTYYVYSEWLVAAFHSIYSPCRNPAVFADVVKRFASDGIMTESEVEPLQELAAFDRLNLPGESCTLPDLNAEDGTAAPWEPGKETLFLVVNLDCASCVGALRSLSTEPGEHIALCYGRTPHPSIAGWTYCFMEAGDKVFELEASPFWFTVDASGNVVKAYTPAPDK